MLFCDTGGKSEWEVVGEGCSQKWAIWSQCLYPSQTHASRVTSEAGSSLSWRPSEEKMPRCSLTFEGHWSQEQRIPPGKIALPCLAFVLHTDGEGESSLFSAHKNGSLRWSEASEGTCKWAALDRLSGNMKRQQLWRRVIASLGLYNALLSL